MLLSRPIRVGFRSFFEHSFALILGYDRLFVRLKQLWYFQRRPIPQRMLQISLWIPEKNHLALSQSSIRAMSRLDDPKICNPSIKSRFMDTV